MFFILSKTLFYFLMPTVWIFGLLVFAFFTRKPTRKRNSLLAALVLFYIFSNEYVANQGLLFWERQPVEIASLKSGQTAIVLTGITMARLKANDRVFFSKGADRLLHTVQLYKAGKVKKIIITGGSGKITGERTSESNELRKVFNYCGVADEDILLETTSKNTRENALNTKKLTDSLQIKTDFLLITSAFHMRRAEGVFKKAGFKVTSFPVDYMTHQTNETTFDQYVIPSSEGMEKWSRLIHEVLGFVVYKALGYC